MIPDSLAGIADTAGSLALALLLGAVIGAERQYRERIASLRTNVLVALGAAAFVDLGIQMAGGDGAMRVLANVVTGVGFLGAGLILREGGTIRGLNTAATVWCSAAVGAAAGANLPVQAIVTACRSATRRPRRATRWPSPCPNLRWQKRGRRWARRSRRAASRWRGGNSMRGRTGRWRFWQPWSAAPPGQRSWTR